ncbi:methylthioribose-1-phosphate isomerase [Anaeramoeba ignava]|uniref:Methylthioribose-1-phosphate isomerase n=1 Tax=Anaeramoeba ignava TaxID=1746090 RepID=A0A9Q0RH03_ANAIG|nr:methylthioribose-1-phosphate isomerase [Anaeramoeba ignava]
MFRSIEYIPDKKCVKIIDQTKLPHETIFVELTTYKEIAEAIYTMKVRGAPLIGVTAAYGIALASIEFLDEKIEIFTEKLEQAKTEIDKTRPTAVNLFWATQKMMKKFYALKKTDKTVDEISNFLVEKANKMAEKDVSINFMLGKNGASLISNGDCVLTHCNAGSLATVLYGTALSAITYAFREEKKKINVISDETRPRLQGATLTAFELQYQKIPVKVISDNSSGLLMRLGKIQKIFVGADRITSDGVFNKIGTYMVALAANANNVPFYVVAPSSSLSLSETSVNVKIEERDPFEVSNVLGKTRIVPEGVDCLNFAFDFTPFDLVTKIITEHGIFTSKELIEFYSKKN